MKTSPDRQLAFKIKGESEKTAAEDLLQQLEPDSRDWLERHGLLSWINRHTCSTKELGILEARIAQQISGETYYVVEEEVEDNARKYWPHRTRWNVRPRPPFVGSTGIYYTGRPNHYIVNASGVTFIKGESKAEIKRRSAATKKAFRAQLRNSRRRSPQREFKRKE